MIINLSKKRFIVAGAVLLLFILPLSFLVETSQRDQNKNPSVEKEGNTEGEFLYWDEVNIIFPKKAEANIIDIETDLQFRVQRRAGSSHADVQPLTSKDSAIMKKIYNGKWSWKRRAIIVELDNGRKIAGSMNGMPHGQGAISGNNFNGHFCIHFRDSTTHGGRNSDLAHQIMVWKAANVFDQQIKTLPPEGIIQIFITAVEQGDIKIAQKLLYGEFPIALLAENLKQIESIKLDKVERIEDNTFQVTLRLILKDSNKELKKKIVIETIKEDGHWKIDTQSIRLSK